MLNLDTWLGLESPEPQKPLRLPYPMGRLETRYWMVRQLTHQVSYHYLIQQYSIPNLVD
ncbi:MAG: hypothetical protein ACFE0J_21535 [Elainellaceae cyanobacterium]